MNTKPSWTTQASFLMLPNSATTTCFLQTRQLMTGGFIMAFKKVCTVHIQLIMPIQAIFRSQPT